MPQLPLLPLPQIDYSAGSFILTPAHEKAHTLLTHAWPTAWAVIEGETGSGKKHLATMWHGREIKSDQIERWIATTISASTALPQGPISPENNPAMQEQRFWLTLTPEVTPDLLFHALNHSKNQGFSLLILSTPGMIWRLSLPLPDLTSRLRQGLCEQISQPDDHLFQGIFLKNLKDVNYDITPEAWAYVVKRIPRSYSNLAHFMKKLRAGLSTGRYPSAQCLTVPFLRTDFSWLFCETID